MFSNFLFTQMTNLFTSRVDLCSILARFLYKICVNYDFDGHFFVVCCAIGMLDCPGLQMEWGSIWMVKKAGELSRAWQH